MYINLPKMSKNVIFKPFYAITQTLCYFMLKIQFYNNFHDFTPSGSPGKGAFKLVPRENYYFNKSKFTKQMDFNHQRKYFVPHSLVP